MAYAIKTLSVLLIVTTTLAQLDDYHGYEGHGFHHEHQSLDDQHGEEYETDYHAHPKYTFDYSVKDPHTGDNKEHWETRDGDKVKGTYTLIENDGTKRVVEYEADDKHGFNAVVHKIGTPKEEHKFEKYEPHKFEKYEPHKFEKYEPHKFDNFEKYEPHKYEKFEKYEPQHHDYHHQYPQMDDGFVPIAGVFDH